ncbi:MAG: hypothetical protein AAB048_03320, partial [Planctomycetota bacterium]
LGCTTEQSVKEENTKLRETLGKQTAQIKEMQMSLESMDKRLIGLQDPVEEHKELERAREGVLDLKLELEQRLARLGEMERDLDHLKEVHQQGYFDKDKGLSALTARIDDLKRYLDMQTDSALRGREGLKNFVIEEARALRVEHQEYTRELESIKGRLQAIEGAMGKKGASDNERRQ